VDDFVAQSAPRIEYYIGRTLEALGRHEEARQAYERTVQGIEHLSGDRDSWNSDNFHMVLALEKLGRGEEAAKLVPHFEEFAKTEVDAKYPQRRAEARYLLALVRMHEGQNAEARKLIEQAIEIEPDFLPPRLDLRGDSLSDAGRGNIR